MVEGKWVSVFPPHRCFLSPDDVIVKTFSAPTSLDFRRRFVHEHSMTIPIVFSWDKSSTHRSQSFLLHWKWFSSFAFVNCSSLNDFPSRLLHHRTQRNPLWSPGRQRHLQTTFVVPLSWILLQRLFTPWWKKSLILLLPFHVRRSLIIELCTFGFIWQSRNDHTNFLSLSTRFLRNISPKIRLWRE